MKLFCILITLFASLYSFAQTDTWVEARGKAGFLVAHRSIMGHLATEHAFAGEFSYMKHGKGEKSWHEAYNYPIYGVTGFVGTVGNRELLGHYLGAYGFISIPLIQTKHWEFAPKIGCGLGFGTKVWNPDNNPLSMAVSTHVNALVSLGVHNRWHYGDHSISASFDMTHFSNGATKVPNLGLNLPYLGLGYGYRISEEKVEEPKKHEAFKQYWEFGAVGLFSMKEVFPTEGRKYPVMGLNFVSRRYFKRSVGMEVSFDLISKQAIQAYQTDVPKTQWEMLQMGVFVGYLLPFDKFHLITGMGYYVKDKFQPEDAFYHRTGMRYVFDNGVNVNLVLKSHWARADYIEYGIGYTFKR